MYVVFAGGVIGVGGEAGWCAALYLLLVVLGRGGWCSPGLWLTNTSRMTHLEEEVAKIKSQDVL